MFLPIGDDQEHERRPVVTWVLIGANIAAFLAFCLPHGRQAAVEAGAFVPAAMRPHTLLTSQFLHRDLLHLAGNMLFLWIFGRLVEERIGRVAFALLYPVCGIGADFLHAMTTEIPQAPVIGASGAVSGAVGAALVFCPRAHVKVFVWFVFWGIYHVPLVVWAGLWFAEQVYFSSRDYGNVAYYAHIGGFAAGAGIGWLLQLAATRAWRRRAGPLEPKDSSVLAEPRRPFAAVPAEAAPVFLDPSVDSFAVVTLQDAAAQAERIAGIVAGPARVEASRGVVARALPRSEAERVRRELHAAGIAAALVADVPANHPPPPGRAEAVSWDDRLLRFRIGPQSVPVPWSAPFLFVAASAEGQTFIDLFVSPMTAFRVRRAAGVPVTRVNVRRRSEESTDLAGLARDIAQSRPSAANEGVGLLAEGRDLGWLAFRSTADYDDYLFWTYNLALSKNPIPGA